MSDVSTLELLHWNDVHGRWPGLARLSARAREIRAAADHPVLLLDGGDVEDTGVRLSALTFGVAGWRLLRAADVDAAVVGNGGLLRYGPEVLPRYAAALGTAPLVCDLEDARGDVPAGAAPSALRTAGRLRVGVIGATDYYPQYDGWGLSERGRVTAVRREAYRLRERGADLVVLLSHAGLNGDRALSWSLRGLVDLIVGGHTHDLLEEGDRGQGVPIAQAGCFAEHLGRVLLEIGTDGVQVRSMTVEQVAEDAPGDPAVLAELAAAEAELEAWLAIPVGRLPESLAARHATDNPAAGLVVRALLHQHPGDLGMLVGGQLTAGFPAGTITRGDVWAATSSPGNAATGTLTGRDLALMVRRGRSEEYAAATPRSTFRGRRRGYLHAPGVRLAGDRLTVHGRVIRDDDRLQVTATDLELSLYGGLLDREPPDLVIHVPAIVPELVEAFLRERHPT